MDRPKPSPFTRLDWFARYREARRVAHLIASGREFSADERSLLVNWVSSQMLAYLEASVCDGGEEWSGKTTKGKRVMVAWLIEDLDLNVSGRVGPAGFIRTICDESGWPS